MFVPLRGIGRQRHPLSREKVPTPAPPAIDAAKFTADFTDILKGSPGEETAQRFEEFTAKYKSQIASAQGNESAAIKRISQLPYASQKKAAIDYVSSLQTPE